MKLGLHIGLNSVQPAAYNGWDGELYAAVADARAHAGLFAQHGYATRALLNEDATLRKVRAELSGLASALKADDTLIISFSGHGSRAPGWIFASYREALCLYDGQFSDQELRAALTAFAPGSRVIVILDCCYSGGMDRSGVSREGAKGAKVCPRFISEYIPPPQLVPLPARGNSIATSALLLTACRADET
ncbi:MAG: caspase family protein, partial [Polyangiaceae bacterium]|nr:caspase family protein [Polyangiaceae bacterium]